MAKAKTEVVDFMETEKAVKTDKKKEKGVKKQPKKAKRKYTKKAKATEKQVIVSFKVPESWLTKQILNQLR